MPDIGDTPFDDLEASAVLSPADIAERLDVSARSVRRAIARGDLPASRTCGLRVLAADAAAWWRSRRVIARPPEQPTVARPALVFELDDQIPRRRITKPSGRLPLPSRSVERS